MNLKNRIGRITTVCLLAFATLFAGCASVPMASQEQDAAAKRFEVPSSDKSGVYIYRDSSLGTALKKMVSLDGNPLFQSAIRTYFYKEITPGKHTLATQSEFGDNAIEFVAEGGKLHFVRNYIKMGVFVGGANLEIASDEEGKKGVNECSLAAPLVK